MKKLIIGFCGLAGSGKDTAANAIVNYANSIGGAAKLAFADPMRDMLLALGVPRKYIEERAYKEVPIPGLGRSYRQLAQTLGTEWGRVCHGEDFWVKALAMRVGACTKDIVVIPDVRFPNEAAWISKDGFLVRINRPGVEPVNPHESERYVSDLPTWTSIMNDRSEQDLEEEALAVLRFCIAARIRGKQPV